MINIINNILHNNGYKIVDISLLIEAAEVYIFCPLDLSEREEYFITVKLSTQSNTAAVFLLEKIAQDLFDEIRSSGKVGRSFEKNCTMLLCHEEGKIDRQTILAIEEDPFNFKKNVITYSPQEVASLQTHLTQEQNIKITNCVINNIITTGDGAKFLEFKENHKHQRDYYSLILKAILKLPFITYTPKEQELSNLDNEIESDFTSEQILIYKKLVSSELDWNDDNIHQQVEEIWGGLE